MRDGRGSVEGFRPCPHVERAVACGERIAATPASRNHWERMLPCHRGCGGAISAVRAHVMNKPKRPRSAADRQARLSEILAAFDLRYPAQPVRSTTSTPGNCLSRRSCRRNAPTSGSTK